MGKDIQRDLDRRKPGQSSIVSPRRESDKVSITSGLQSNVTLGTPMTILVANKDARPQDYEKISVAYRPSHADYTYDQKYHILAQSGGGRSSARETVGRVAGGAVAKCILRHFLNAEVVGYVVEIGGIRADKIDTSKVSEGMVESNLVRCPDQEKAREMEALIKQVQKEGDSVGGVVECVIRGLPAGLGAPVGWLVA